jgi:hypothetical protein
VTQRQNETDAHAETELLPKIDAAKIEIPARAERQPAAAPAPTAAPASPAAPAAPSPAGHRRRAASATETAAVPAAAETVPPPRAASHRKPIAVPEEFFVRTPPPTAATEPAEPSSGTETEQGNAAAATAGAAADPAEKDPADKKRPAAGQSKQWRESVPFDETGVLLRPEMLRHRAMVAETELISAIKLKEAEDDGSEAAQSQRPGFWTGVWPRRMLLLAIMLIQAVLSLRNNNSPFEDESLYLYSGHLELGHLLNGTSTVTDFWAEFSGAPVFYPIFGALADQLGGLFLARLCSLLFMLGATGLVYLMGRRLFGARAGLYAAALFACTEPTIFLGNLATYDAPALFLLALSAWIVVRFAAKSFPWYLIAVFPAALAVGTKYVSLLFLPSIVALALLVSLPHFGRWALIRPVALTAGLSMLVYTMYEAAGPSGRTGISLTTTNRPHGTDSLWKVMSESGEWVGWVVMVAVAGAVCLIRLPSSHTHAALPKALWQRICLGLLMVGSALLAPVYQAHLHTVVSLQKHVGFGLIFAAPLAGYGLVRLVGPNFHRVQLGIGVLVIAFALAMGQSIFQFHYWPNSYSLVTELAKYQKPGAHYFFSNASNAIYELRGDPDAEPAQFIDAFYFGYVQDGKYITGDAAYAAAIQSGYFQVIAYDYSADPATEASIAEDLYHSPNYKLVARVPELTWGAPGYGYVWVLKK